MLTVLCLCVHTCKGVVFKEVTVTVMPLKMNGVTSVLLFLYLPCIKHLCTLCTSSVGLVNCLLLVYPFLAHVCGLGEKGSELSRY